MGWNQSSALVLDDGTAITESIAICRYFEAVKPDPPLFGRCALAAVRALCVGGGAHRDVERKVLQYRY
jgi:glutathione S-transferase